MVIAQLTVVTKTSLIKVPTDILRCSIQNGEELSALLNELKRIAF